jgi:hypothetical protein
VFVNYSANGATHEKPLDADDFSLLERIGHLAQPAAVPTTPFPIDKMYHGSRLAPKGFTHVHHLYLARPAQALGALWAKATVLDDAQHRHNMLFWMEQAIWGLSLLNRYQTIQQGRIGGSQVNRQLTGLKLHHKNQATEERP